MKFDFTLNAVVTKQYKGIEAKNANQAELLAIKEFINEHKDLNIDSESCFAEKIRKYQEGKGNDKRNNYY